MPVQNNLGRFVDAKERDAARALAQCLILGAAEASVLTPIDTGNLLNSQFKLIRKENGHLIGTVGYSADYALPVHDPSHAQNFRRVGAEKEFLAHGMERAQPEMLNVLAGALRA